MSIKALSIAIFVLAVSCENKDQGKPETAAQKQEGPPGIETMNKRIEDNPNNAELYYNRADLYFNNGEVGRGIEDLQRAIGRDSSKDYFYLRLADEYLRNESDRMELPDSRKAIETLENYLRKYPANQKARLKLADIYLFVEQYEKAINTLDKAIDQESFNPKAYFKKGVILKYAGDTIRAINQFQKAVEQDPELYDAYMQLGLLAGRDNPDMAATYFDHALSIEPESKEARYAKAKLLQDAGAFEKAKKIYREMVTTDAQNEDLFFNLGYIFYEQDSLTKSERQFDIAIQLDPAYGQAYYARGIVREALGKYNEAIRDYENALSVNPEHPYAGEALNELKENL